MGVLGRVLPMWMFPRFGLIRLGLRRSTLDDVPPRVVAGAVESVGE